MKNEKPKTFEDWDKVLSKPPTMTKEEYLKEKKKRMRYATVKKIGREVYQGTNAAVELGVNLANRVYGEPSRRPRYQCKECSGEMTRHGDMLHCTRCGRKVKL